MLLLAEVLSNYRQADGFHHMSPHSKSRPRIALTVLVTLAFAALAVWL